jgi:hypothetical protein
MKSHVLHADGGACDMTGDTSSDGHVETQESSPAKHSAGVRKSPTEIQQTIDFISNQADQSPAALLPATVPAAGGRLDPFGLAVLQHSTPESRYATDRLYAEGGIGRVWLAHDKQLNRQVAIKTLRPEHLEQGRARSRFLGE